MDFGNISAIAVAVLVAAIILLRVIAPKTVTSTDDKALSLMEKILAFFGKSPPQ